MHLQSVVTSEAYYKGKQVLGRLFEFSLVTADDKNPENKEFFEASPPGFWYNGQNVSLGIKIYVVNPEAANQFEVGKNYYIDFTEAPQQLTK